MAERILLVDDEDNQRVPLRRILEGWGYEVEDCASVQAALGRIGAFQPSVVITDLVMPVANGIDLIRELRREYRGGVIVLSGKGTIEKAVEAIKEGADDFLEKPLNFQKMRLVLDRMREKLELVEENRQLRERLAREGTFGRLRGGSRKMREVYGLIEQIGPSHIPVLITGESGTGKELVARTIHDLSARRKGPFVAINAAAIPRELIESELFGHERGAFTGAIARKIGCFEMAHNGTLLLDEIAEMEEATQAKLLRVLQEQSFRRIGGAELIEADVRVLAATNRDPKQAMAERKLRKDLYYRLAVITIHLPPLRERADDIPPLAQAFIKEVAGTLGQRRPELDPGTVKLLAGHRWPGNVRELRNSIERAMVLCSGSSILPEHLPAEILAEAGYQPRPGVLGPGAARQDAVPSTSGAVPLAEGADASSWAQGGLPEAAETASASASAAGRPDGAFEREPAPRQGSGSTLTIPLGASAAEVEKELIRRTLEMTGGNKTRAAKILGLSLKTIHNKAKKYGL